MSIIQRPGKEGNATTYQGKVAAGYTKILASEVDADIDTMYSAWNSGVDTVNIKDGAVTQPKLAAGAVGGSQIGAGAIQTANLADGAVTDAKVHDVSWSKIVGGSINQYVPINPRVAINATGATGDLEFNTPDTLGYDNTKASWIVRGDYTTDAFTVFRAPPPGTAFVPVFALDSQGNILAGTVGRNQVAVNAIWGTPVSTACPSGFNLANPNVWSTYLTLPPLVTRGGYVVLKAEHNLSCSGPTAGGIVAQRWLRTVTPIIERAFFTSSTAYVPLPGLLHFDNPPAGNYTYTMQLWVAASCVIVSTQSTQGSLEAIELG